MRLSRRGSAALPVAALAVTVAAAIPLTANAAGNSAGNSAGAAHLTRAQSAAPGVYDCANKPQVKPGTFDIFCDGSYYLSRLKWTGWNGTEATGTGTSWLNNCTPNCAAGKWTKEDVIVVLWRPQPVHGHKGKFGFSKLTLLYPGSGHSSTITPPGAF